MIGSLYNWIFGCRHDRFSFPLTPKKKLWPSAASLTGTYVACLECGQEFAYDWQSMRIIRKRKELKQKARVVEIDAHEHNNLARFR